MNKEKKSLRKSRYRKKSHLTIIMNVANKKHADRITHAIQKIIRKENQTSDGMSYEIHYDFTQV